MIKSHTAAQISQTLRAIEIHKQATLNHALATQYGVTAQQAITLQLISKHPGLIQKDVVDVMKRKAASVSAFLKKLEAAGLIRREIPADNSRNKQIYLTETGDAVVAFFQQQREKVQADLVANLSQTQQEQLLQLLQLIQK